MTRKKKLLKGEGSETEMSQGVCGKGEGDTDISLPFSCLLSLLSIPILPSHLLRLTCLSLHFMSCLSLS